MKRNIIAIVMSVLVLLLAYSSVLYICNNYRVKHASSIACQIIGSQLGPRNQNTLAHIVSALQGSNATVQIDGIWNIATELEIPQNVELSFFNGGILAGAGSVIINGPIDAGFYQIFSRGLTVSGAPIIDRVIPEWFGAKGQLDVDDTSALRKAGLLAGKIPSRMLYLTRLYATSGLLFAKHEIPYGLAVKGEYGQMQWNSYVGPGLTAYCDVQDFILKFEGKAKSGSWSLMAGIVIEGINIFGEFGLDDEQDPIKISKKLKEGALVLANVSRCRFIDMGITKVRGYAIRMDPKVEDSHFERLNILSVAENIDVSTPPGMIYMGCYDNGNGQQSNVLRFHGCRFERGCYQDSTVERPHCLPVFSGSSGDSAAVTVHFVQNKIESAGFVKWYAENKYHFNKWYVAHNWISWNRSADDFLFDLKNGLYMQVKDNVINIPFAESGDVVNMIRFVRGSEFEHFEFCDNQIYSATAKKIKVRIENNNTAPILYHPFVGDLVSDEAEVVD